MPDPQTQTPGFISDTPLAPAQQQLPAFIPDIPAMTPQPAQEPPTFIPDNPETKPSDGSGFFTAIYNGLKNTAVNVTSGQSSAITEALQHAYNKDWTQMQTSIRKGWESEILPFMKPEDVEKNVEATPDEGIVTNKGAWTTTKTAAMVPLGGTFHRKDAGPIESETENWITGQLNPLNIGLAIASMGGTVVESGLVKAGVSIPTAAGIVRVGKIAGDLAFLSKFGYDVGTQAIPEFERDWNDFSAEHDPAKKKVLLDQMKRHGTDLVLGTLTMGLATRGIESGIQDYRANSPKGQAVANGEYFDAIHTYQAENQVGSGQARQLHDQGIKAVPDALRREGIANNIEAEGHAGTLREWADKSNDELKPGYEAGIGLTDKEMNLRDRLRGVLDAWKARLRYQNLLSPDGGRENYIPHRPDFEDIDPVTRQPINKTGADGERGFMKKRIYPTHAAGEQNGINYKSKDAVKLVADYVERANNMIARNNLGENLAKSNMNDGSPMAVSGGFVGVPRDAELSPAEIHQLTLAGKLDALLKKGRVYKIEGDEPQVFRHPQAPSTEQAPPPKPTPGPPALPEIAGSQPNFIPDEPTAIGPPSTPPPPIEPEFVSTTRPSAQRYAFKFDDYADSGLRINRPTSTLETPPPNALVARPDPNSFSGDAIMRMGADGIPTDPKTGQPMARVPVYVNPEVAPHLLDALDSSAPKNALVRWVLKGSSGMKSILLSMSPFHWNTMITRALEGGMSPVKILGRLHQATYFHGTPEIPHSISMPDSIDYNNLTDNQMKGIQDGLVVSNTHPGHSDYLAEGNASGHESWATQLPLVGKWNKAIESRLFGPQGFITGLKFDLYDQLKTQISKSMPTLDETQVGRIAAQQVNNKFGGLNYTLMGRGASTQTALRAFLLAPDFLESTGRSALDVAGKNGMPLVKSLVAFNILHWMTARAINYLANGSYHPESGFKVVSQDGKKEYGIRTTLGDFLHFAEHPRDFAMNRVNPLLVRTPGELIEGVDQQGNKISNTQKMWDTARQVMPIPLQPLLPKQQISQPSGVDEFLKGMGIGSVKKFSPAETLAYQRSTQKSQGAPLEGDALEKAQNKYMLSDAMRDAVISKDAASKAKGIRTPAEDKAAAAINDARKAEKITPDDQKQMIEDAYKYPTRLAANIQHLPIDDALDVYAAASQQEKKQIRHAVLSKVQSYYNSVSQGKKPLGEYRALAPRIQKFFADKP
jgi:hypothetical protein